MGAKKLKAIAIRGDNPPAVANKEKIMELARWMGRTTRKKRQVSIRSARDRP